MCHVVHSSLHASETLAILQLRRREQAVASILLCFAHCFMRRVFEGMQLVAWTRLSGLTGLTLRRTRDSHHRTLAAVLPRMTALQSLVLTSWWPQDTGGCCALLPSQ
jgi:hypothetical protein